MIKKHFTDNYLLSSEFDFPFWYILLVCIDYLITFQIQKYGLGFELSPVVAWLGFGWTITISSVVFMFVWSLYLKDFEKRLHVACMTVGLYFFIYLWHYIVIFRSLYF